MPPRNRRSQSPPTSLPSVGAIGIIAGGLALLVIVVYGRMVFHDFVNFDDNRYVTENPRVLAGLTVDGLRWAVTTLDAEFWHPLTWLSLMLDSTLFGTDAVGYLVTNLILHLANTLLLFAFFWRTTKTLWPSALVAALFAVHPLHVESVAWIAQRKDLLSTFFGLWAMLAYIGWWHRRGWWRYSLVLIGYALALMAKPMWVTLPFLLMLLHLWPLTVTAPPVTFQAIWKPIRSQWHLYAFMLAMTAAACAVALAAQDSTAHSALKAASWWHLRLPSVPLAYATYLRQTLWPAKLAFFYPFPQQVSIPLAVTATLLLIAVTVSVLVKKPFRNRPWLAVGWLWFLGTLVPVSGLIKIGEFATADRYTYLPLVGLFMAAAWTVHEAMGRRRHRWPAALMALVVVACGIRSWQQVAVWQNQETLATHAIAVTRDNYLAHNLLGIDQLDHGRLAAAEASFQNAIRIRPNYSAGYYNLARLYVRSKRFDKAETAFRGALKWNPQRAEAHVGLGRLLLEAGRPAAAVDQFRQAVAIEPTSVRYRLILGDALIQAGKPLNAKALLTETVAMAPDNADVHVELGRALEALGDAQAAERHYATAMDRAPENPAGYYYMANRKIAGGRPQDAIWLYQQVLARDPQFVAALNNLAMAQAQTRHLTEAMATLERLAVVDPSSPSPCYNLAALHARNQEAEQAIGWLNKAFDRGFHDCRLLKTDADFQGLRGKPTFEALMTHQCR